MKKVKLGEVFKLSSGKSLPEKKRIAGNCNVYGGNGITGSHNEYFVEKRTVVIGRVGEYCGATHLTSDCCWVTDNALMVTDWYEEVNQEFMVYLLNALDLNRYAKTVGQPSISQATIYELEIMLPEISYQVEIVEKLNKIKRIINDRSRQILCLDELVKSRFVELFGDPLDNTKGLPVEPFANCCLDMHQGINTVADKVEYQPSGYPIIQSKNITKGFLDLDDVRYLTNEDYEKYREKYNPKVNDILICNIGTIGKSLVIKDEKNFLIAWNLFLVKLNLEKVNPDYIKAFVEFLNDRHYYDQFLTGGTVKFVNKKTMGNIPVLMPSTEQQNQFSDFVKQTDKSKLILQKNLKELEILFDSLMHKAFN